MITHELLKQYKDAALPLTEQQYACLFKLGWTKTSPCLRHLPDEWEFIGAASDTMFSAPDGILIGKYTLTNKYGAVLTHEEARKIILYKLQQVV